MTLNLDGWRVLALVALVYGGVVSVALLLVVIQLAGYIDKAARREDRDE